MQLQQLLSNYVLRSGRKAVRYEQRYSANKQWSGFKTGVWVSWSDLSVWAHS